MSGSPYVSATSPTSHHPSHQPPTAPSSQHYPHRNSLHHPSHPPSAPPNSTHRHNSAGFPPTTFHPQHSPANTHTLQHSRDHPVREPAPTHLPQPSHHHPQPQRDRRDSLSREHLHHREREQHHLRDQQQRGIPPMGDPTQHTGDPHQQQQPHLHQHQPHHHQQQQHHHPQAAHHHHHQQRDPHHLPQPNQHAVHSAHSPSLPSPTPHPHAHQLLPPPTLAHLSNPAPVNNNNPMSSSQPPMTGYSGPPPAGPSNGTTSGPSPHLSRPPPPHSQPLQPPALPSNGASSAAPSRQLAQPPPPPPGAPAINGTPAGEEAMVAAIIRDGEVSLANDMGDWRPPTNPLLERLVKETELTWLAAGNTGETLGNYSRAVECYERALRQNPLSVPALTKAAGIYRHQENFKLAADYFSRLLKIHEGSGEIWGALGHCYLMIDDLQKAYTSYQQALHHFQTPKSEPKLWYGIGILYDRYGSLEHAEEAFNSVIKMDPNFEKANEIYFRLGIIYKQQGKADLSLDCFQWILDKPPSPLTEIDIWFQVGHVHEQQGHYDRAKEAYERVLDENPTHAKVLQQLGGLYCREGSSFYNPEQAVAILTRSLAADSHDAFSWYLLGRACMTIQNFNKAYESYQQAVYRDGKNPAFWCSIGVLYYAIMQYHDSLDAYSRAIRLNPYISEVWYNLGALYESCNDQMLDAIDAYQRAAQLDSNNSHINARLNDIKRHQETGAALTRPPSPRDMSHTSANWPFPNSLNGSSDHNFGPVPAQHEDSARGGAGPGGPASLSPVANTATNPNSVNTHLSSAQATSPLTSRPNAVRPGTSGSSIMTRPQSPGSFSHHGAQSQHLAGHHSAHPSSSHLPPTHSHPPGPHHPASHTASTLHRRQSGGYGSLAPMELESSHAGGRGQASSQHNLPHLRSVVDSQSRGPSPAPASDGLRRSVVGISGPGSRDIASPRTSPSIRAGVAPNERGNYPVNAASLHHTQVHSGPPPVYSRHPPGQEDGQPVQSNGSIASHRDRERERPSREPTRFRRHSPEFRAGPSDRGARSPNGHPPSNMYPPRGEFGPPAYTVPTQPQHQSPYDPRHASPTLRGPPTAPQFSPESGQSPTWSPVPAEHRLSIGGPPPSHDGRHTPSQPGYPGSHPSQTHQPSSSQANQPNPHLHHHHHHQQQPPVNRRYDPRYDEPVSLPNHRPAHPSADHTSPHRPGSAALLRQNVDELERHKHLTAARQAQPSPTPSVAASEFSAAGGNGVGPGSGRRGPRNKPASTNGNKIEEDFPPVAQPRRRKTAQASSSRNNLSPTAPQPPHFANVPQATANRPPPVQLISETAPPAPAKRERKKVASTKVRNAMKSKANDSSKGPSPSPVPPTLPTADAKPQPPTPPPPPSVMPDRKVDEEFDEYDEVADALLSFAGQPPPKRMLGSQSQPTSASSATHPIPRQPRATHSSKRSSSTTRTITGRSGSGPSPSSAKSPSAGVGSGSRQSFGAGSGRSPSNSSHRSPMESLIHADSPDSPQQPQSNASSAHNHVAQQELQVSGPTQPLKRMRVEDSNSLSDSSSKRARSTAIPSPIDPSPSMNGSGLGSATSSNGVPVSNGAPRESFDGHPTHPQEEADKEEGEEMDMMEEDVEERVKPDEENREKPSQPNGNDTVGEAEDEMEEEEEEVDMEEDDDEGSGVGAGEVEGNE
ncbi:hypothetical protein DFH28DRAFT_884393 [Melampsora americana]|nr:hypothetical protein DFH28DRAFT_884393 [Melampsora americana]